MVSVPIGHPDDITLRAIETLRSADFLVCEEKKTGHRLISRHKIKKPLYTLNEHNERESSDEIIQLLLKNQSGAYFSDAGTPVFADPGRYLVNQCHQLEIPVIPIPGPSSLTAAMSVAGIDLHQFYYAGFLPRDASERRSAIRQLKQYDCPVIIYDTPYRLKALLEDVKAELTGAALATLLLSLTQPEERILRGPIARISAEVKRNYKKREFVLILESPAKTASSQAKKPRKRR